MLRSAALGAGVTAAGAAGLVAWPSRHEAAVRLAAASTTGLRGPVAGTTLARTLRLGTAGAGGYRKVVAAAGEAYVLRRDLGGTASSRRITRRRGILSFGHLTDVHIIDAQSPARVEYLDRLGDRDSALTSLPVDSSHRPQEMLSTYVAEAMVRAMNRVGRGPVTGLRLAFSLNTGDASDNAQYNETRWIIDLLDGGRVQPDSGDLSKYEGVMDRVFWDRRYWHPDGPPTGMMPDLPMERFGFPQVKGLLDAARAPFDATGLNHPWLVALGNHDQLVQGNLPTGPLLNGMATGAVKITAPSNDAEAAQIAALFRTGRVKALTDLAAQNSGLVRLVTPDPKRRLLSRADMVREHFSTTGLRGHGFTQRNLVDGTAYYGFTRPAPAGSGGRSVRGIVLDTNNPSGYADGSIDRTQLRWLEAELKAGSSRYYAPDGTRVRHVVKDKLFVLFSHHTLGTMVNGLGGDRVLGDEIEALLLRFPNVVLWVNGHTHVNEVIPHRRTSGGGFWEVNTAAHIDWPQQSRIVELVDNTDGTLSIFATLIDSGAPESYGGKTGDPLRLAALSRELSANDWQDDNDLRRGKPEDRNVELLLPAPF